MGGRVSGERLEAIRTSFFGSTRPSTSEELLQIVRELQELRSALAPLRALGAPLAESVHMASQLFACGATEKQVSLYSRASASGVLHVEDQLSLREAGVRVQPLPASADELFVIATAIVRASQASEPRPFTPEAHPSQWAVLMLGAKPVAALVLQQLEAVRRG